MIAELTGSTAVNELLPGLAGRLDRAAFAASNAGSSTKWPGSPPLCTAHRVFHKDLYLCHFFLDAGWRCPELSDPKLSLIDLHRLEEHRLYRRLVAMEGPGPVALLDGGGRRHHDARLLRFWIIVLPAGRDQAARDCMRGWSGSERRVIGAQSQTPVKPEWATGVNHSVRRPAMR